MKKYLLLNLLEDIYRNPGSAIHKLSDEDFTFLRNMGWLDEEFCLKGAALKTMEKKCSFSSTVL